MLSPLLPLASLPEQPVRASFQQRMLYKLLILTARRYLDHTGDMIHLYNVRPRRKNSSGSYSGVLPLYCPLDRSFSSLRARDVPDHWRTWDIYWLGHLCSSDWNHNSRDAKIMGLYLRRFVGILSALATTYAAVIVPGATWTDTSGNVIQAHGAGILKVVTF